MPRLPFGSYFSPGLVVTFADGTNDTMVLKRVSENGLEKSQNLGLAREAPESTATSVEMFRSWEGWFFQKEHGIIYPIFGDSNNANLWLFFEGVPLMIVHCLGWCHI